MSFRWPLVVFLAGFYLAQAQTFEEFLAKGDVYYNAQNYPEAIRFFTLAIQKDSSNIKGYWYRADALRQHQEFTAAINDYTRILEWGNRNAKFYTRRGDCYFSLSKYELALQDYSEAVALDPENAKLWLYMGDCHEKLNNPENACFAYQKAFLMGDKSGKTQALQMRCAWIQQNQLCNHENTEPKIEIENLTGALVISKGLQYKNFEVLHESTKAYITGSQFPLGQYFNFLVNSPKGFCADDEGKIFFGIGFWLLDEANQPLGYMENMFEGNQGVPTEFFNNLKATLDFQKPLDTGKHYTLKLRYFDKRGTGEISVLLPLTLTDSLRATSEIFQTHSTLGKQVTTSSTMPLTRLVCYPKGKNYTLAEYNFYPYSAYVFSISAPKISHTFKLSDQQLYTSEGMKLPIPLSKYRVSGNVINYELNTWKFKPGKYLLWSKFTDENSGETFGITTPFSIR